MGEFYLETVILEFWGLCLLGIRLNGRLGRDLNPNFKNYFKHTEKTKLMSSFSLNSKTSKYILKWSIELKGSYSQSSGGFL